MLKRLLVPLAPRARASRRARSPPAATTSSTAARTPSRRRCTRRSNASSFNWSVVPGPVVIHIGRGVGSHAAAGADLARRGPARLGPLLLGRRPARVRAPGRLRAAHRPDARRRCTRSSAAPPGGAAIGHDAARLRAVRRRARLGLLAFSGQRHEAPSAADEGGQFAPAAFRAALPGASGQADRARMTASVKVHRHPRKGESEYARMADLACRLSGRQLEHEPMAFRFRTVPDDLRHRRRPPADHRLPLALPRARGLHGRSRPRRTARRLSPRSSTTAPARLRRRRADAAHRRPRARAPRGTSRPRHGCAPLLRRLGPAASSPTRSMPAHAASR